MGTPYATHASSTKACLVTPRTRILLVITGSLFLAGPQFVSSSSLAPAEFGIIGEPQNLFCLITCYLLTFLQERAVRPPWAIEQIIYRIAIVLFIGLLLFEGIFFVMRGSVSYASSFHGFPDCTYLAEQLLRTTCMLIWITALYASKTSQSFSRAHQATETNATSTSSERSKATLVKTPWLSSLIFAFLSFFSLSAAQDGMGALSPSVLPPFVAELIMTMAFIPMTGYLLFLLTKSNISGCSSVLLLGGTYLGNLAWMSFLDLCVIVDASSGTTHPIMGLIIPSVASILFFICLVISILTSQNRSYGSESGTDDSAATALNALPGCDDLTPREFDALVWEIKGASQAQTAERLGIAPSTVATYRSRGHRKLGMENREELLEAVAAHYPGCPTESRHFRNLLEHLHKRIHFITPLIAATGSALFVLLTTVSSLSPVTFACGQGCSFALLLSSLAILFRQGRQDSQSAGLSLSLFVAGLLLMGFRPYARSILLASTGPRILPAAAASAPAALALFLMLTLIYTHVMEHACLPPTISSKQSTCALHAIMARGCTETQARVALATLQGHTARQIANDLCLSVLTVASYRRAVYRSCKVHSRKDLLRYVQKEVVPMDK